MRNSRSVVGTEYAEEISGLKGGVLLMWGDVRLDGQTDRA